MKFEFVVDQAMFVTGRGNLVQIVGKVTQGTINMGDAILVPCGGQEVPAGVIGIDGYKKLLDKAEAPNVVILILKADNVEPALMDAWKTSPPKTGSKLLPRPGSEEVESEPVRDVQRLADQVREDPYAVLKEGIPTLQFVLKTLEKATDSIVRDLDEHGSANNMLYGEKDISFFHSLKEKISTLSKKIMTDLNLQ